MTQVKMPEPVMRIYAEGGIRTVTEWRDGARDLPDGDGWRRAEPRACRTRGASFKVVVKHQVSNRHRCYSDHPKTTKTLDHRDV